ncbi:hypothetical protein BDF22DRAFT_662442 [Syncephalis plumigaleata]|nr:hypothetical protein BDF22DRAFT_662442 [Syncephalis plumigaleata]
MHFLFILIWILIIQISHSYGKLTISNGNDTMTVSTLDYFNYRQPYYSRRGIGILWPWANRTTATTTNTTTNTTTTAAAGQDCTLMTVNLKRPIIVNTAKRAANYPDTALFFYREPALQAGCQTVAQVGRAAQKLSEQLESVGFPAITLLIFMVLINNTVPAWGPDARMYTSRNSPNIPDGPPAIDTMFLEQTSSYAFYSSAITKEFGIYFEAEEEPGPWNDVFLSHGFIAYSWILFALILLALLYLWARVIKFIQLKTLPRDLRLTIFIITSINAILVLVCLKIDTDRYQGYIVQNTAIVISALLFDLLLIHWSIRGRVAFSRWSIFCFRAIILLDIVFLLASFGVGIFIFNIGGSLDYDWLIEGLYQYFLFPLPVFAILVYGGFGK